MSAEQLFSEEQYQHQQMAASLSFSPLHLHNISSASSFDETEEESPQSDNFTSPLSNYHGDNFFSNDPPAIQLFCEDELSSNIVQRKLDYDRFDDHDILDADYVPSRFLTQTEETCENPNEDFYSADFNAHQDCAWGDNQFCFGTPVKKSQPTWEISEQAPKDAISRLLHTLPSRKRGFEEIGSSFPFN